MPESVHKISPWPRGHIQQPAAMHHFPKIEEPQTAAAVSSFGAHQWHIHKRLNNKIQCHAVMISDNSNFSKVVIKWIVYAS